MVRGPRIYNETVNFRCTEAERDLLERAVVMFIARTGRVVTVSSWARAHILRAMIAEIDGQGPDDLEVEGDLRRRRRRPQGEPVPPPESDGDGARRPAARRRR